VASRTIYLQVVEFELITKEGNVVGIKGMEEPTLGVGCNDCGSGVGVFGVGVTTVEAAAAGGTTTPGLAGKVVAAAGGGTTSGLASRVVAAASVTVWLVAAEDELVESVKINVDEKVLPLESTSIS
jgi:hypothetical protein